MTRQVWMSDSSTRMTVVPVGGDVVISESSWIEVSVGGSRPEFREFGKDLCYALLILAGHG